MVKEGRRDKRWSIVRLMWLDERWLSMDMAIHDLKSRPPSWTSLFDPIPSLIRILSITN
jgi:hypothetical protein